MNTGWPFGVPPEMIEQMTAAARAVQRVEIPDHVWSGIDRHRLGPLVEFNVDKQLTLGLELTKHDRAMVEAIGRLQARDLGLVPFADTKLVDELGRALGAWSRFAAAEPRIEAALAPLRGMELTLLSEQLAGVTSSRAFVERFPAGMGGAVARTLVGGRRSAAALKELSPEDLETKPSPAAAVFGQVSLVASVSGAETDAETRRDASAKRESLLADGGEQLEEKLHDEPVLLRKLQGGRAALAAKDNPDRAAQFSVSMRGLLDLLLERVAPLEEVTPWAINTGLYKPGEKGGLPLRQSRFRFLGKDYGSGRLGKFVVTHATGAAQLVGVMNELVHGGEALSEDELLHLQLHAELLVRVLVEHPRFRRR